MDSLGGVRQKVVQVGGRFGPALGRDFGQLRQSDKRARVASSTASGLRWRAARGSRENTRGRVDRVGLAGEGVRGGRGRPLAGSIETVCGQLTWTGSTFDPSIRMEFE